MKPKRITAAPVEVGRKGVYFGHSKAKGRTHYYLLRRSEIRELAEQILEHANMGFQRIPLAEQYEDMQRARLKAIRYAFRRAGMTPGKARAA